MYQNNGTVAMLVYQANTVRGEPEYSRQKVPVPEHKVEVLYLGSKVQGRSQAIDLYSAACNKLCVVGVS